MIKRHLLQPMIPGTIHPLHHQLSLHPRLDPFLLNPFHHALQLPVMDTTSIERRIGSHSSLAEHHHVNHNNNNNNSNNNNRPSSRPLRSFLIEDILKHSPKRSHVPQSETVVSGATTLSCDSPPLPRPASIRSNRASSDRDSQDSSSIKSTSVKSPKKEPESTSSTPSPKSSTTSSEYNHNSLAATLRESTTVPKLTDTKGKDPNLLCNPLSSLDGKDVVWPAWVYCTRYSDRPSSGEYTNSIHTTNS